MTESNFARVENESDWDVVIVGAGPAGGYSGLLCARSGLRTLLVEKQKFPRHKICGCCLNSRAVGFLKDAGIWSGILTAGARRLDGITISVRHQKLVVPLRESWSISRGTLDQLLVRQAVEAGCVFVDGVSAQVAGPMTNSGQSLRRIKVGTREVQARVVLVCDGLGHSSLDSQSQLTTRIMHGSRVGLGGILSPVDDSPSDQSDSKQIQANTSRNEFIRMIVGNHGYAGLAPLEDGRLNVAAAVDPEFLKSMNSPAVALLSLFEEAGELPPNGMAAMALRGTRPLTQNTSPRSLDRLLLLGDAAGYVEPFTGEGIAWALASASLALPAALDVCRNGWSRAAALAWERAYCRSISRKLGICRLLSSGLRRPWMLQPMITFFRMFPSATGMLAATVNGYTSQKDAA
ncbi:MAG: NAD(P)/FAD-dependent oxidoreductase [Planctomyces sp.]|nr:NAD(P)/FAD-dependent oxidoreductase [Planctomyces sp.]